MGKYRDQIKLICAYPWGIRLAEISDEIDARVDGVAKALADLTGRTESIDARVSQLEAKVAACCGGSPLKDELAAVRVDVAELKTQVSALVPKP